MEEMELDGADARRVEVHGDAEARADFPVVVIGCGRVRAAGRHPAEGGRHPLHHHREERRRRRDLVGEHLPGGPGRRRQPLLLLQLRAERRLDRVLRPAARAPGLLRVGHGQARDRPPRPVGDRGARRRVGRRDGHLVGPGPRRADGTESTLVARAVISAVGQLNRPHVPEIAGPGDFAGPAFHSARWDHSVDLTGKRVALIGAGASGFQIAPTIAADVAQLTVFQRTAQWMFPNPNYHAPVGPGVRWALRHLPFYGRWYRFLIFWPGCGQGAGRGPGRPRLPRPADAPSAGSTSMTRQVFTEWITSQVGDDPELLAKVMPDYPATGKRTLQDNGSWLRTLTRDNVELVRDGDRPHRARRRGHHRRPALPGRRHRLRHRLLRQPGAVADGDHRPRRPGPAGPVGRAAGGLPRASRCPGSPTSSACTGRAPTWPTAAA